MTVEALMGAAIGGLIGATLVFVAAARGQRVLREGARAKRAAPFRSQLLNLAGETDDLSGDLELFCRLDRRTWAAIEPTVIELTGKLKGASRTALVGLLLERGTVERTLGRSRRRRPLQRVRAAEMLATLGTGTAARLYELVDDPDPEVRSAAVRALGRIGDPSVVPALLSALQPPRSVPRRIVAQALLRIGAAATPELIGALGAPEVDVAAAAADVLGVLCVAEAAPKLVEVAAGGRDPRLQRAAVAALGRIGAPTALEVAVRAVEPGNPPDLRAAGAQALGRLGHPRAIPLLMEAAGDPVDEIADRAVQALVDLGPAGREALRTLADDPARPGSAAGAAALAYVERAGAPTIRAEQLVL